MFREDVSTSVSSPETKTFFEGREDADQLIENKVDLFHSVVEKLLLITKRSRPALETFMSFLTTIVSKSNIEGWEKTRRILRFVCFPLKEKGTLARQI